MIDLFLSLPKWVQVALVLLASGLVAIIIELFTDRK